MREPDRQWRQHYRSLVALARRHSSVPGHAEDLVQEALLEALLANRPVEPLPANLAWLAGVIRNRAKMSARSETRRRSRENSWQALRPPPRGPDDADPRISLGGLSPALAAVALLAMSGHSRSEIAYLLRLPDTALRQRIAALKRHFTAGAVPMPSDLDGLRLALPYGRIRNALMRHLPRQQGNFATHDPDGHLFVIRGSQTR